MNDSALTTMEHQLARSRVGLSIAALISVYVDPTTPTLMQWIPRSGGLFKIDAYALTVLTLHLCYAGGIYLATALAAASHTRTANVSTVMDVLFGVAVALVTEGATSPAYVFFAFAILAVGCRAGFRVILEVTAACVGLYFGVILLVGGHGADLYIMRPAYLGITGYLIAYLAQRRLDCELRIRDVETQAERQGIARTLHDGYVQALAAVNLRLENCRKLLERERRDDALAEIADLQGGVRHEYDEVRAYVRSLADLGHRAPTGPVTGDTRCTVSASFAGSGVMVEHALQIMLEGVRNVRRHAQATSTEICVRATPHHVTITIDDDGVGFSHEAGVPWTIASRVKECGGEVRIAPAIPHGAHLIVDIPEQ